MAASILYPTLALVACTMVTACASDSPSDRQQRPVYSFENVDMGPNQSGQQYRTDEPPPRTDPYSSGRYGR